ncbi:MAG: Photosystem I assembly protein Ycf3 [Flavobacteriales bacterium]|nr:Photosystem I assembly protein Ycf3 [Flavobacteriales bacterium]
MDLQAQTDLPKHKADSLWKTWKNEKLSNKNRFDALYNFTWNGYLFTQPDTAFKLGQLAYNFAKSKGLKKEQANAINILGISSSIKGDFEKAISYFKKGLIIFKEIDYKQGLSYSYGNIGLIYHELGNYAKAIEYQTQSLKIDEKLGNKYGIASSYNNIGNIYHEQKYYEKAIEFYSKGLKLGEEIKENDCISSCLLGLGSVYYSQKKYNKALDHFMRGLEISKENDFKQIMANALGNIGLIYYDQGNYSQALEIQTACLKIDEELEDKQGISISLVNIGNIYFKKKDYKKSVDFSNRALAIAKEIGSKNEIKQAALSLFNTLKATAKHEQALEMHELYVHTKDSIENEENRKEVIRQEYKYNYEKQAAADSIANANEKKLKDVEIAQQQAVLKAKRNQQYGLFGGLFLVLIFAGILFNRLKITQQQKVIIEKQKEIVEEKQKEILDSIHYAKRIQDALLTSQTYIARNINRLKNNL